ncbi:MAG: DUF86 domain-containing protein [Clostridia bacterium]|nr:DUF86 domain-containing protein [Clostridia bacterium]
MLRTLSHKPQEEFLKDTVVASAAKYQLLIAVEAALDLCAHVCVKCLRQAPAGYADCFERLQAGGILSQETGQRLVAMACFRNLLVHQYGDVDDARVYRILQQNLGDLDLYLEELGRYLNTRL